MTRHLQNPQCHDTSRFLGSLLVQSVQPVQSVQSVFGLEALLYEVQAAVARSPSLWDWVSFNAPKFKVLSSHYPLISWESR